MSRPISSGANTAPPAAGSWRRGLPLLIGAALALILLSQWLLQSSETHFEEMALGATTISHWAEIDGRPLHCHALNDAEECLDHWLLRGAPATHLWLGNSQLHAINQGLPGQWSASDWLFRFMAAAGRDLIVFSQPNANLQEHLLLFEYLRGRITIERLVLPVVFDDLRETGIRAELNGALRDESTRTALSRFEVGRKLIEAAGEDITEGVPGDEDRAALRSTVQERCERFFTQWLTDNWLLWAKRPEASSRLKVFLYQTRNQVFGITPQDQRRMIPALYARNMAALEAILANAAEHQIPVTLYIPPLRGDVAPPFVPREYQAFKQELGALAGMHGRVTLHDLSTVIPATLYGTKASTTLTGGQQGELDFKHFQAGGHRLLAEALAEVLNIPIVAMVTQP